MLTKFQKDIQTWLIECIGKDAHVDKRERLYRFLEESIELAQACDCPQEDIRRLVTHVYHRNPGTIREEAGGAVVTLAALCAAHSLAFDSIGQAELKRIQSRADAAKQKQAARPEGSYVLQVDPDTSVPITPLEELSDAMAAREEALAKKDWLTFWLNISKIGFCDSFNEHGPHFISNIPNTGTIKESVPLGHSPSFTWQETCRKCNGHDHVNEITHGDASCGPDRNGEEAVSTKLAPRDISEQPNQPVKAPEEMPLSKWEVYKQSMQPDKMLFSSSSIELCHACNGHGYLLVGVFQADGTTEGTAALFDMSSFTCNACHGHGRLIKTIDQDKVITYKPLFDIPFNRADYCKTEMPDDNE